MMISNRKKSRGQSTAEYAIVIGFVVAAIVAMQIYVRRGLQGKVKTVTDRVGDGLLDAGVKSNQVVNQYEPYYASSNYNVTQTRKAQENISQGYVVNKTNIGEETKRTGSATQGTDLNADNQWTRGNTGGP